MTSLISIEHMTLTLPWHLQPKLQHDHEIHQLSLMGDDLEFVNLQVFSFWLMIFMVVCLCVLVWMWRAICAGERPICSCLGTSPPDYTSSLNVFGGKQGAWWERMTMYLEVPWLVNAVNIAFGIMLNFFNGWLQLPEILQRLAVFFCECQDN